MSNTKILKNYLLEKENAYFLDDNNNGKTIMLSGAWGSGKTHFWKEEIEREQKKIKVLGKEKDKYTSEQYKEGLYSKLKDKEKACVYVSLYGKTSIESLELDVYMKAYQNIVGEADAVSTMCSVFTNLGKNLGNMAHKGVGGTFAWMENLVDKDKFDKAGSYLEDGGIICFDDFERKSKEIDLNDLFGFISQLALEYRCKVVIILNSDVFIGKEAEVFSNVKEKTISKFFYFNPSIEELFKSISDNSKYDELNDYKENILSAIKETEELNARIYTQVLDNCLEWIKVKNSIDLNIIRVLILSTFNFILNHVILDYQKIDFTEKPNNRILDGDRWGANLSYTIEPKLLMLVSQYGFIYHIDTTSLYKEHSNKTDDNKFLQKIHDAITYQNDGKSRYTEKSQEEYLNWMKLNKKRLQSIWKYGHRLYYVGDVNEESYNQITNLIVNGILLP